MPIAHIQPLTGNDLIVALQQIDALPIDAAAKRLLKDILKSGSNPNTSRLETIIKTLPKERQAQIYRFFEEIAARQKQQVDDAAKALLLLGLLTLGSLLTAYIATPDQETLQTAQILNIMTRAYMQGIQDEINALGLNVQARQPSGEQLAYLTDLAKRDSQSIIATWNKDAQKALVKLYQDNPNASKQFFIENMTAWAEKRLAWKALSIAFNSETQAREYGRSQFALHNYPESARYIFKGSPPVCEDCMERFAVGAVSLAYTRQFPCPRHPNCEHYWAIQRKPQVDSAALWAG